MHSQLVLYLAFSKSFVACIFHVVLRWALFRSLDYVFQACSLAFTAFYMWASCAGCWCLWQCAASFSSERILHSHHSPGQLCVALAVVVSQNSAFNAQSASCLTCVRSCMLNEVCFAACSNDAQKVHLSSVLAGFVELLHAGHDVCIVSPIHACLHVSVACAYACSAIHACHHVSVACAYACSCDVSCICMSHCVLHVRESPPIFRSMFNPRWPSPVGSMELRL